MSGVFESKMIQEIQNHNRQALVCPRTAHIVFEHRPQVHVSFYSIFTMEKVAMVSNASKYVMKRLINNLGGALFFMGESRENINKGFEYMID